MIPGIELTDGATRLVVAPMNLRIQLEEPTKADVDRVRQGVAGDVPGFEEAAIRVLLACTQRNHPDATRAQLLEMVDSADLLPLLIAILNKSGFEPRPLTDPRARTTEAAPAAATPSPAPASSDSSSTPPDGSPTTSSTDSPGATTST